jgi:hypothetical protein
VGVLGPLGFMRSVPDHLVNGMTHIANAASRRAWEALGVKIPTLEMS